MTMKMDTGYGIVERNLSAVEFLLGQLEGEQVIVKINVPSLLGRFRGKVEYKPDCDEVTVHDCDEYVLFSPIQIERIEWDSENSGMSIIHVAQAQGES